MITLLKRAYRKFTPRKILILIGFLRKPEQYGVLQAPCYLDDGLMTQHLPLFREDSKFVKSYAAGKETGSLKGLNFDIEWRAHTACWCASQALKLEGDLVECGVGRGLLSKTIVTYTGFESIPKKLYLIDTYQGLDTTLMPEGENRDAQTRRMEHIYKGAYESVKASFASYPNVELVRGSIPAVLKQFAAPEKVCYLSIDMNNAVPELAAAEFFWPRLVRGGMILLDDFAGSTDFASQTQGFQKFAMEKGTSVLTLPTGQGLIIKL